MKSAVDCVLDLIVLDIEGTTTPIAFVYDVLFPFARTRLRAYLRDPKNRHTLAEPLRLLREERQAEVEDGPPEESAKKYNDLPPSAQRPQRIPNVFSASSAASAVNVHSFTGSKGEHSVLGEDPESAVPYVEWLMDQDRKSPGLKLLQGQIWEDGYRHGLLRGEVFGDVAPALRRWRSAGLTVAIYSSGSELAQRLLFGSTASGDLTPLLTRFFDTAVGSKQAVESYRRIARELGTSPDRMLFISDVTTELDAARAAGCQAVLCVRPGNRPQPSHGYPVIESFDDIPTPGRSS